MFVPNARMHRETAFAAFLAGGSGAVSCDMKVLLSLMVEGTDEGYNRIFLGASPIREGQYSGRGHGVE